jgi:hypothetical protein
MRLKPVPALDGHIELRNGFRYGGLAPPILEHQPVAPGKTVAIVGRAARARH